MRKYAVLTALVLACLAGRAGEALGQPPGTPAPAAAVANQAFDHLKDALAGGKWEPLFDLLADDIEFWFPTGKYAGRHQGKTEAVEFFRYVASVFPQGLRVIEVVRRTGSGSTFVFEFVDEGALRGEPYRNRVAISLDVCGAKICGYREYFGSDGKPGE